MCDFFSILRAVYYAWRETSSRPDRDLPRQKFFEEAFIEGSDPGPVKIPSGGARIDIQTWIWVGIGLVLLAGFILVILAVRRRKRLNDKYHYE